MLGILGMVLYLGCIICWIMVLIKMFQDAGLLHGILGLICGLYAFIWGWINADRVGIKNIMMIWTLLGIISIVLGFVGGFSIPFMTPSPTTP
jgi:hypothetical protein